MNSYTSINLLELKNVYWVFREGGAKWIAVSAFKNCMCSVFLVAYVSALLFCVDWRNVIENKDSWMATEVPCGGVCLIIIYANVFVTSLLLIWSILSSILKCRSAYIIEKGVQCALNGSVSWDAVVQEIAMGDVPIERVNFFICAEMRQTAVVLKLLKIHPASFVVSRYLVWSVQNTLSISRRGISLEASALNIEIETLDIVSSKRRIKKLTAILLLTSPFFIMYYALRVLVSEFHRHKTRRGLESYTWSAGAKYDLRKKNELTHRFKRRLGRVQRHVEAVKKSRKSHWALDVGFSIIQFALTCVVITFAAASFVSIEEGAWNEPLGLLTGALSACLMVGSNNSSKIDAADVLHREEKIRKRIGKESLYVEKFLDNRALHVLKELVGVLIAPFFLMFKLLPRLDEVRLAIEQDMPEATESPDLDLDLDAELENFFH